MTPKNYLLPCLLGIIAFTWIVGLNVLIPTNIAWLAEGDAAAHYLGWTFFRHSPWTWPILGLNPQFGLEISSGIIAADSNPLFAFIFKSFSLFLPEPFQYFGFWILLCFILQALFGWKLLSLISDNVLILILGTAFFLFSPPFLNRITTHMSLGGHFLILAALYVSLEKKLFNRKLVWGSLIFITALVHPYLLAMVTCIWMANLVFHTKTNNVSLKTALLEFFVVMSLLVFACWQEGYFVVGVAGSAAGGYGLFRMNLLSPIDSFGWSYVLKSLPHTSGDAEGFNYLGLGLIILSILSGIAILRKNTINLSSAISQKWFLFLTLICFTIFAISDHIGIGSKTYNYNFPPFALIGCFLRASGRMFWPVWYMIVFTVVFILARTHKKHTVAMILSIGLIIQIFDTHAGWKNINRGKMTRPSSQWTVPLHDSFWDLAAKRYQKIRNGALGDFGQLILSNHNWITFAYYSSVHHLSTDLAGISRIPRNLRTSDNIFKSAVEKILSPEKRVEKTTIPNAYVFLQNKLNTMLETGEFEKDSLYILDKTSYERLKNKVNTNGNFLAEIDGVYVLAPNWYAM